MFCFRAIKRRWHSGKCHKNKEDRNNNSESCISDQSKDPDLEAKVIKTEKKEKAKEE